MRRYILLFVIISIGLISCATVNSGFIADEEAMEIHMVESNGEILETGIELPPPDIEQIGLVAFVRGSGGGDMREYFPGFMDKYLREVFLVNGYAIIYANKRGIGDSSGNWKRNASFTSMAEDTLSVINYYSGLEYISSEHIGVIGHSQGGWIVQRVAGIASSVDFAVSLVGPVTTLAEQDLARTENMLVCEGRTGAKFERLMKRRIRTHNLWRNAGGWFPYFELGFMHNVVDDSTTEDLRSTSMPFLLGYGGSDGLVPVEDNLHAIATIFPGGVPDNISVMVADDADHYLTTHNALCNDYSTIPERPFSTDFFNGYISWLEEHVFSTQ